MTATSCSVEIFKYYYNGGYVKSS